MHPRISRSLAHERRRGLIDDAQQARAAASRRRTRRALLAASVPAAVAAFVLPAAADAATTVELSGGTLSYRADTEKTNTVAVRALAGAVEVRDLRGVTARGLLCVNVDPLTVRCGLGTQRLRAVLGDRNDSITIRASFPADIDGGPGEDTYIGAFGPEPTRVRYTGGAGFDAADYVNADRGIRLSNDGVANDGRPGFDQDSIGGDVERLTGTRFGDELTAAGRTGFGQVPRGEQGDDVLRAAPFDRGQRRRRRHRRLRRGQRPGRARQPRCVRQLRDPLRRGLGPRTQGDRGKGRQARPAARRLAPPPGLAQGA